MPCNLDAFLLLGAIASTNRHAWLGELMGFRIILIKYLGAWPAPGSEDTE